MHAVDKSGLQPQAYDIQEIKEWCVKCVLVPRYLHRHTSSTDDQVPGQQDLSLECRCNGGISARKVLKRCFECPWWDSAKGRLPAGMHIAFLCGTYYDSMIMAQVTRHCNVTTRSIKLICSLWRLRLNCIVFHIGNGL